MWHCDDMLLTINQPVATLQVDMCKNLTVHFTRKELLGNIVWAGIHNFKVIVGEDEESGDVLKTGVDDVKNEVEDYKENFDQFIVRYVDGKLTQELIVRLKNGFPTTDREADAFDERQKKNEAIMEEHVRKFMDVSILYSIFYYIFYANIFFLQSSFVESKLENVTKTTDDDDDTKQETKEIGQSELTKEEKPEDNEEIVERG